MAIVALVLAVSFIACRNYRYYFGFDRAVWLATAQQLYAGSETALDNPRESMVQDVLAHELRLGMPRAEVVATLGAPDFTTDDYLEYQVGWSFLDPDFLVVRTKQGRVTQYQVENH